MICSDSRAMSHTFPTAPSPVTTHCLSVSPTAVRLMNSVLTLRDCVAGVAAITIVYPTRNMCMDGFRSTRSEHLVLARALVEYSCPKQNIRVHGRALSISQGALTVGSLDDAKVCTRGLDDAELIGRKARRRSTLLKHDLVLQRATKSATLTMFALT